MFVKGVPKAGAIRVAANAAVSLPTELAAAQLISNFGKVSEGLYRGTRISLPEQAQALRSLGVKNVVNLQGGDAKGWLIGNIVPRFISPGENGPIIRAEAALLEAEGIQTISAPLGSLKPISAAEDAEIDRVLAIMADPTRRPLYLHCEFGKDRTGLLVALHRVKHEGVAPEVAIKEWESFGHDHSIHFLQDMYFASKIKTFTEQPKHGW
jgi:rhodanese-related sulfurtransferase